MPAHYALDQIRDFFIIISEEAVYLLTKRYRPPEYGLPFMRIGYGFVVVVFRIQHSCAIDVAEPHKCLHYSNMCCILTS